MERIKELLGHIEKLPDSTFTALTSDPVRMQAIRTQFHAFIEANNVKMPDGRRLKKNEIESLFSISVVFDNQNHRLIIADDKNSDRQMLNLFLSYYTSRLELTPPRNRGLLKKTLSCLGWTDEENISFAFKTCGTADPFSGSAEPKPLKDSAQKKAERMQKHTTGVLPVAVPVAQQADSSAPDPAHLPNESMNPMNPNESGNNDNDSLGLKEYHVFEPLTLDEILTTPQLDFLTDNLIVRNTVNVFFAPAKTGKTYLCLNYAICLAMDLPFLGMENHLKKNVGYLNLDMFRGGFNDRVKQVIKGFNPNATPEYIRSILARLKIIDRETIRNVRGNIPNFYKEEFLDDLQNFILVNDIEFLFIDTFSRVRAGSAENDNDDMAITLQNIEKFFSPLECGCLIIHHTGKDGKLRGASAIIDNAEFVFGLRKVNNSNKHLQLFSDTPRYTDVFELDVYPIFQQCTNDETGASHADSYFLSVSDPDKDSSAVLKYLESVGNAYTSKRNLSYKAGGNYDANRKEIESLYAQGILERVESGRGFSYRKKMN